MTAPLQYRWATPDDLPAIVAFWCRRYGPDSVQATPGRAAWLFGGQPAGLHVAMAEADGAVVALCGHLVQTVPIHGHGDHEAAFGVDLMVDPAHRRRGIARALLDMRLERFTLSLSTGQSDAMAQVYRQEAAVDLGGFFEARFCRRPDWRHGPRCLARDLAAWLAHRRARRIDGRRDSLPTTPCRPWLDWRFRGPVYQDYTLTRIQAAGHEGLLAGRTDGDDERLVHLEGPTSARPDLLAAAARSCRHASLVVHGVGDGLARDLDQAGFMVRPRAARLVAMTRDESLRGRLRSGTIDLFAGASDADLIRFPGKPAAPGPNPLEGSWCSSA